MAPMKDEAVTGGADAGDFNIDEESMLRSVNASRPFGEACERVLVAADVPLLQETRQLASIICGSEGVSGLAFVQTGTYTKPKELADGTIVELEVDALEEQANKIAKIADERVDSPMVWWPTAKKIALEALRLRDEEGLFAYVPLKSRDERSREVKAALAAA